jgi:hypothetical protein
MIRSLDKVRACLESAAAIEANAIANTPKAPPPPVKINIYSVPANTRINDATLQRLDENSDAFPRRSLIDYVEPTPEPDARSLELPASAETDEALIPRSSAEAKLLAELDGLTDEQLRDRAIQCSLDPSLLNSS